MKLYSAKLSPFAGRVRIAIHHKGIEDKIAIVYPPAPLNTPEWKQINPIGKIPVLETNGRRLVESEVILEYLEEMFPERPLLPANLEDRALARTLNRICDLYIFEPFRPLFQQMRQAERDAAVIETGVAKVLAGLGQLEYFLPENSGPFAIGGQRSVADCGIPGTLFFADRLLPAFGVSDAISRHPKIAHYWAAANEEPIARQTIAEHQAGLDHLRETGVPA